MSCRCAKDDGSIDAKFEIVLPEKPHLLSVTLAVAAGRHSDKMICLRVIGDRDCWH